MNKLHKVLLTILVAISLAGCEKTVIESSKVVNYKIIDIKSPKHFRVTLQDNTGRVFQNVAVSKHCNRWREVQLNTKVSLVTDIMKRGNERWININALSICPGN